MPPRKKKVKKPTTVKSQKRKPKKILKLVPLKPKSDDQEWINHQIKKLSTADKALVITVHGGQIRTGWINASKEDIVYLCNATKFDLMIDDYT